MYDYIIAQKDLIVVLSSISPFILYLSSLEISHLFVYRLLFFLSHSYSPLAKSSINHPTMKISFLSKPCHITISFKKESQDQNQNRTKTKTSEIKIKLLKAIDHHNHNRICIHMYTLKIPPHSSRVQSPGRHILFHPSMQEDDPPKKFLPPRI
ncbi:hypothetical protein EYC80_004096 [Monilinia laxa]|uniref:Uncharacterized protein n=1 Tax=Monilinia laxa TaxID=61186 RepID=A0A5N6KM40_MONLA|nr:hypothetical protein EYC80_004096 [Monilinia laxa]